MKLLSLFIIFALTCLTRLRAEELHVPCDYAMANMKLAGDKNALNILYFIIKSRMPKVIDESLETDFEVALNSTDRQASLDAALRAIYKINSSLLFDPLDSLSQKDTVSQNLLSLLRELRELAKKSTQHDLAVRKRLPGFLVLHQSDLTSVDRFRNARQSLLAAINADPELATAKNNETGLAKYEEGLKNAPREGGGSRAVSRALQVYGVMLPIDSTAVGVMKPGN